jgi:hypothetical protein
MGWILPDMGQPRVPFWWNLTGIEIVLRKVDPSMTTYIFTVISIFPYTCPVNDDGREGQEHTWNFLHGVGVLVEFVTELIRSDQSPTFRITYSPGGLSAGSPSHHGRPRLSRGTTGPLLAIETGLKKRTPHAPHLSIELLESQVVCVLDCSDEGHDEVKERL